MGWDEGFGFGVYRASDLGSRVDDLGCRHEVLKMNGSPWGRMTVCRGSALRTGPPVASTCLLPHLPVRGSIPQTQTAGIHLCALPCHLDVIQLRTLSHFRLAGTKDVSRMTLKRHISLGGLCIMLRIDCPHEAFLRLEAKSTPISL